MFHEEKKVLPNLHLDSPTQLGSSSLFGCCSDGILDLSLNREILQLAAAELSLDGGDSA